MEKQSSGFPRNEQKTCAHGEPVPLLISPLKDKVWCPGTKFEHGRSKYAQQRRSPRFPQQTHPFRCLPSWLYAALDVRAFHELVLLRPSRLDCINALFFKLSIKHSLTWTVSLYYYNSGTVPCCQVTDSHTSAQFTR